MGCPDWPKCFGQWIPPTSINQIPEDYKEHYIAIRKAKNENLAKMIAPLGLTGLADQISNDPSIYEETDFIWQKTWIEYINRLSGALLGFVLILAFFSSLNYWNKTRKIPLTVLGIVVITGFQGWMGSVVVSTNLMPGVLTAHMLLAFVIITGLVYLYVKTADGKRTIPSFRMDNTMRYALGILILLTIVQVLFGTQIRQQIDNIAKEMELGQRELWIGQLDWKFLFHRSFSILILIGNAWICYQIIKYLSHYFAVWRAAIYLGAFVLLEILTGVVMAYLSIPAWSQPLHLFLSCLLFGVQVYLFMVLGSRRRIQTTGTIASS